MRLIEPTHIIIKFKDGLEKCYNPYTYSLTIKSITMIKHDGGIITIDMKNIEWFRIYERRYRNVDMF